MNLKLIGILSAIVVVLTAILYISPAQKIVSPKEYTNAALGIAFSYPANYVVEEREAGNGERRHYSIMLADEQALAQAPINGEGPTAITFDFYQNNLDTLSVADFVTMRAESNYKLSTGEKIAPLVLDGREAFTYSWDGLYRGISGAIAHGDWILVASVTTLTPEDQIAKDFRSIIEGIRLSEPAPL